MLLYAGQAHAAILDAMDTQITDEQWEKIQASAFPIDAKPAPTAPLGAYFPGWHGVAELGW